MKCPKCGEEIHEVLEKGSKTIACEAYWSEDEEGVFLFSGDYDLDTIDSHTDKVVCPNCEESLKYRIEKGKMVIENE